MHPALIILGVVLGVHITNLIGRQRIEALVRPVYLWLFHGQEVKRQRSLKKQLYDTRQQLNMTSSQDQFAKWAKLRRAVDKHVAQLEQTNAHLASASSMVSLLVRAVLFLATTLFPFCLTFYFGKTPMFYLPPSGTSSAPTAYHTKRAPGGFEIPHNPGHAWGMINETYLGPLGWLLCMTAAPRGSVSAGMWSTVCTRVLLLVTKHITDLFRAVPSRSDKQTQKPVQRDAHPQPEVAGRS